jgi:hypothetical protein
MLLSRFSLSATLVDDSGRKTVSIERQFTSAAVLATHPLLP